MTQDTAEATAARSSDQPKPLPPGIADREEAIVPPRRSDEVPEKRRGGGFAAFFAICLALLAVILATLSVELPVVRPWVKAHYGELIRAKAGEEIYQIIMGPPAVQDAHAGEIELVRNRLTAVIDLLTASDATVQAQAGRIATLENALTTLSGRVDTLASLPVAAAPVPVAATGSPDGASAAVIGRIEAQEKTLDALAGRVGATENGAESLVRRLDLIDPAGQRFNALADHMDSTASGLAAAQERIAQLDAQVTARLTAVEGAVGGGHIDRLDALIAALGGRISAIETASGESDKRAGGLEGKVAESLKQARLAQLALLGLQLNGAAQTHRRFDKELAALQSLAGDDQTIKAPLAALAVHAETGAPTIGELRDSFSVLLMPRIKSMAIADEQPWNERLRSWLSATIAPGATAAPDVDATQHILAGAIQSLAEDDLKAAVTRIAQLEGPAASVAARWQMAARARLVVDRNCEALAEAIVVRLAKKAS